MQADERFLEVCKYVEANPLRAGMVKAAEDWPWSSLFDRRRVGGPLLPVSSWPIDRPRNWLSTVNRSPDAKENETIAMCIQRDRPYGSPAWVQQTAAKLGLTHTIRNRGRPRLKKE